MSVTDKRQTRQRVLTIGACAAVFAFGGPLIAQRFGDQKAEEAYRANAIVLAESISGAEYQPSTRLVSFSNKANVEDLLKQVSYAAAASIDFEAPRLGLGKNEAEEINCLAEAVYYEARSEGATGPMAVAEVVMNRVRDPRFPKTVCDVVYQGHYRDTGCQFTFTCDGSLRHAPNGEAWDRAKAVALNVALGLSKPITHKATHYHTDYVNPYWKAGMVETKVIGTHIFYRFPKTSSEWATARINLEAQEQRNMAAEPELLTVSADAPAAPEAQPPAAAASLVQISAKPLDAIPQAATQVADSRPL
jgi:spore germination cell wall hydrolase CwlJ-like protein